MTDVTSALPRPARRDFPRRRAAQERSFIISIESDGQHFALAYRSLSACGDSAPSVEFLDNGIDAADAMPLRLPRLAIN